MSNLQQEINNTQAALDSGALTEGAVWTRQQDRATWTRR
jgi:hypothetical protein